MASGSDSPAARRGGGPRAEPGAGLELRDLFARLRPAWYISARRGT